MIRYLTQRYEPDGSLCGDPVIREMTPGHATTSLVRFELGYGGHVTALEPTRVVVRTSMFGRYDITEFSGDAGEMMPLMRALCFWLEAQQKHGPAHVARTADQAVRLGLNRPLMLQMFASLMWSPMVPSAICVAADLPAEKIHSLLETPQKLDDKQFDPVMELIIDGQPVEEALALLA